MTVPEFVGLDPSGVGILAAGTDEAAVTITAAVRTLDEVLLRCDRAAASPVVTGRLQGTAAELGEYADGLRWRADVIGSAPHSELNPLVEFAYLATFRSRPDPARFAAWRNEPDLDALGRMSPTEVAAAFAATAPSIGEELARTHPHTIGAMDGAPPRLRYLANRLLIAERIAELEEVISGLERPDRFGWLPALLPRLPISWFPVQELKDTAARRLREQVDRYREWLAEDRQILLFDPIGDGKVVEVFGDLDVAKHVAVVVPGMANDLDGFDRTAGGFRDNAATLQQAASAVAPGTATIAWLGYDTPDGLDAAWRGAAETGAPSLQHFLEGIDPGTSRHLTVVAHSYGSVLAGFAAGVSLLADDLVVVGSPGMILDTAAAARLRPGGRVWSALAAGDPIAAGIDPSELPPLWLPGFLGPLWFAGDMSDGPETLWHGPNPADDDFGARRISTEGCSGHSEYFEAGSLDNLALIVRGRFSEVVLAG